MAIDILDRIGQKVPEVKQAGFMIERDDEVIRTNPPQLLKLGEQSATMSADFGDTTYRYLLYLYAQKLGSTANQLDVLDVIWQREVVAPAIPHEPSESELLDSWDRYLEEHWGELVAQYKGKYVAIWKDAVYDSDEDIGVLAERVYAALGYCPIFMPYIGDKEQVYTFISPL